MSDPISDLLALGARAIGEGHLATAAQAYERALGLEPMLADAWFNLGWVRRAERRFAQSLDAYDRAIAAGVERPEEAYLNRAAILSDHLFDPEAAIDDLERALALNAAFVPAWISLGTVAEDLGRVEQARAAFDAAVRLAPGSGRAQARLAAIATMRGEAPQAAAALRGALPLASTPDDQADMLFALGAALDAEGSYDDAYQAFEAGNWLARSVARTSYDAQAHERLVDRTIAACPRPLTPLQPDADAQPVFICGMFRSGSTLAEQILGRHPDVATAGELETVPALVRLLGAYPETLPLLSPGQWRDLRDRYLGERGLLPQHVGAWTDKRCDNYLHIGFIKALFPEAIIVETVRQPLDNILSAWFLRFGEGVPYSYDLTAAAHHYIHYRRLMAHWHALFPDSIHRLNYDQVVVRPRATIAPLLTALGLPWNDHCLTPEKRVGAVRTASAWQVRQPLHAQSSGRWMHYTLYLDEVREMLTRAGL